MRLVLSTEDIQWWSCTQANRSPSCPDLTVAMKKVAPAPLFLETVPPRGYSALENLKSAAGDNTFVNTIKVGSFYRSITDSQKQLDFDPITLHVTANVTWHDRLDLLNFPLGSAHPLPDPNGGDGCTLGLHPQRNLIGGEVLLYRLCPEAPNQRVAVTKYSTGYLAYFHSFGMHALL